VNNRAKRQSKKREKGRAGEYHSKRAEHVNITAKRAGHVNTTAKGAGHVNTTAKRADHVNTTAKRAEHKCTMYIMYIIEGEGQRSGGKKGIA
jgi:hypothetical protein